MSDTIQPTKNVDEHGKIHSPFRTRVPKENVIIFAIGQGGANLANVIRNNNFNHASIYYINTAIQDLESYSQDNYHIHRIDSEELKQGTGKDSAFMFEMIKENPEIRSSLTVFAAQTILREMSIVETHNAEANVTIPNFNDMTIFTTFTSAGGTGSGVGPSLAFILNSQSFFDMCTKMANSYLKGYRPVDRCVIQDEKEMSNLNSFLSQRVNVFNICSLPSIREGMQSMQNTLSCLNKINDICEKNLGRFFLTNVDSELQNKTDLLTTFENADRNVAQFIDRYFNWCGTSQYTNLDVKDRRNALKLPGLHSIIKIKKIDDRFEFISPFYSPEGSRAKQLCSEISDEFHPRKTQHIDPIDDYIQATEMFYDDANRGWYSKEQSLKRIDQMLQQSDSNNILKNDTVINNKELNDFSVIHTAGFTGLSQITETYKTRYTQILKRNTRDEDKSNRIGTGLNEENFKAMNEFTQKEYRVGQAGQNDENDFFS